mgnify:CR=1 FL=1
MLLSNVEEAADEIARLDVAIGDSVWLIKANDIIPKVIRVTERPPHRRPILMPTQCPFCGGEVGFGVCTLATGGRRGGGGRVPLRMFGTQGCSPRLGAGQTKHLVSGPEKFTNDGGTDKSGCAGNKYFHYKFLFYIGFFSVYTHYVRVPAIF